MSKTNKSEVAPTDLWETTWETTGKPTTYPSFRILKFPYPIADHINWDSIARLARRDAGAPTAR